MKHRIWYDSEFQCTLAFTADGELMIVGIDREVKPTLLSSIKRAYSLKGRLTALQHGNIMVIVDKPQPDQPPIFYRTPEQHSGMKALPVHTLLVPFGQEPPPHALERMRCTFNSELLYYLPPDPLKQKYDEQVAMLKELVEKSDLTAEQRADLMIRIKELER